MFGLLCKNYRDLHKAPKTRAEADRRRWPSTREHRLVELMSNWAQVDLPFKPITCIMASTASFRSICQSQFLAAIPILEISPLAARPISTHTPQHASFLQTDTAAPSQTGPIVTQAVR
jgi:hypothetical protein